MSAGQEHGNVTSHRAANATVVSAAIGRTLQRITSQDADSSTHLCSNMDTASSILSDIHNQQLTLAYVSLVAREWNILTTKFLRI